MLWMPDTWPCRRCRKERQFHQLDAGLCQKCRDIQARDRWSKEKQERDPAREKRYYEQRKERRRLSWTPQQEAILRAACANHERAVDVMKRLKRSSQSIVAKCHRMELTGLRYGHDNKSAPKGRRQYWNSERIAKLHELKLELHWPRWRIAAHFKVSPNAIVGACWRHLPNKGKP